MKRAFVGAMIGGGVTFAIMFTVIYALTRNEPNNPAIAAAFIAALLGGNGATAGAVIGAAGDFMAYLQQTLPIRHGPEADYQESPPPIRPSL